MKYETKSIIIGRMKRENKDDEVYPCFVSLFDINEPHKTAEVPKKKLEFEAKDKISVKGMDFDYLLAGNDIVINNLEHVDITEEGEKLLIKGLQNQ
ncbi:MAG: hypothetical protein ACQESF_02880 [Nanobdellota archaeon]